MKKFGGGLPIIKLATVDMPTKFGKTPRPLFEIVGWDRQEPTGDMEVIPRAAPEAGGMNDEISF
jgi:hypothetical protein